MNKPLPSESLSAARLHAALYNLALTMHEAVDAMDVVVFHAQQVFATAEFELGQEVARAALAVAAGKPVIPTSGNPSQRNHL